jgi:hypothetical protein
MGMGNRFGRMVPNMKVIGGLTKHVGKENSGTLTVTFSKVNGWTTKPTDTEFTFIKMAQDMRVNGKMIFNTDSEKKYGLITVSTRVITLKV